MTRDDIMALANQTAGQHWMDEAHVQRFAALVAAAEREAILQMSRDQWFKTQAEFEDAIRERNKA
jgi:hypothetical protein